MPRQVVRDFGTSLAFDGATTDVTVTSQLFYQNTGFTVSFWVKGNTLAGRILCIASTASINQVWFLQASGNKLNLFIRNDTNTDLSPAGGTTVTPVLDNNWHQVTVTDSNGTCKVYIDGVLDSANFNYTRSGTFTINRTGFGALVRATASSWFTGIIDDIRIWNNTVLSATDVTNLYYQNINPSAPTSWYKFDEGSGTTAIDSGSLALNGAATGTYPTYSTQVAFKPRTIATGRTAVSSVIGNALSFNGTTSKATATSVAAQDSLTNATISLWFNATNYTSGGNFPRFFVKGNSANTVGYLEVTADGGLNVLIFNSDYATTDLSLRVAVPSTGAWHHIVVTTDGSATALNSHIYIDGIEPTYTLSQDGIGGRVADGSTFTVGNRGPDVTRGFTGSIDDIRVYNRQLTAVERATLFAMGDVQSGLVGWWTCDSTDNGTSPDSSSSNTPLTLTVTGKVAGNVPVVRRISPARIVVT